MTGIIKQRGEGLRCEALHCLQKCPASKAFCDYHWKFLDPSLRNDLVLKLTINIQADGRSGPHPLWRDAVLKAIQWIALKEGTVMGTIQ
jgi:hypothetical protein